MRLVLAGIALGVVAALGSAQLISKMVWGVSASEPVTLALVSLSLASFLLASQPAHRAARVDPALALRG